MMNRKLLFLLAFAVIVLIVAYRLRDWDFDWPLFFSTIWNVQPAWLAASLAATFLTYVIRAFRWQVLLGPLKSIGIAPLLSSTLVGFSAIYVLGRAGEVVRPIWLSRREQVSLTASVATIIVERFLDTLMLVALFAWSLMLIELPDTAGAILTLMKNAAWMMVIASSGAIVLFVSFSFQYRPYCEVRPGSQDSPRFFKRFAQGLSFLKQRRRLGSRLAHSAALWVLIALQFWFMMLGMNFDFSVQASTLVLVAAAIGSIAQVPGIGGGFQAGLRFLPDDLLCRTGGAGDCDIAGGVGLSVMSRQSQLAGLYMIVQGLSFKDLRTATVSE